MWGMSNTMCRRHSPLQEIKEARQIALDYGCYLVEKKDARGRAFYLLFRRNPKGGHGIFIGKRGTPAGIWNYVCKVCLGYSR
jgi:hypothetical protein